jgi:hypothetical protein
MRRFMVVSPSYPVFLVRLKKSLFVVPSAGVSYPLPDWRAAKCW